jgi:hypothetical protein
MTLLQERRSARLRKISRGGLCLLLSAVAPSATLGGSLQQRHQFADDPYQPRASSKTLGVADVHLVSLNPKLEGLIVPSKFYGIAAAGRPTLFIGASDGEIARLIDQASCGFTVAPGDGKTLMDRILQLAGDPELCASMGARARAAFEQHWDKGHAVEQWAELLRQSPGWSRHNRAHDGARRPF